MKAIVSMLVVLTGCARVPVIDGKGWLSRKCHNDQAAFVPQHGKFAVCLSQRTAEFMSCAISIGAGPVVDNATTKWNAALKATNQGEAVAGGETKTDLTQYESASAEILHERAQALKLCQHIVQSTDYECLTRKTAGDDDNCVGYKPIAGEVQTTTSQKTANTE